MNCSVGPYDLGRSASYIEFIEDMSISANCLRINDAMPPPKRKLELCRSFSEHGFCHYGENCFFAHGLD